jgi:hypothetical protein
MTHSLESLGIQEMNAHEVREVEGGFWPWVTISSGWFNTVNLSNFGGGGTIYA